MRKVLIIVTLALVTNSSFSQQTKPSPTLTKQEFILKSKHQKTAAWVFLGGGFALSTIGVIIATPKAAEDVGYGILLFPNIIAGNPQPAPNNDYTGETVLVISGVVAMLSSVPLFIASSKNKRKAMSLSFKNEPALQSLRGSLVTRSVPSLNFKISL